MTFEEARAELKEISGGRYRSLNYNVTEEGDQILIVECRCYVDPAISEEKPTWREALDGIKERLAPTPEKTITANEAPIDESAISNTRPR